MTKNNLVIVESPAKAKTIEKILGKEYKVMSSFGHIRDLKKRNFGVNLETFDPEYEIPADKKHVVSELRQAAKGASTVWLASDEDREGEAISWHLAEVLKLDPKTARRIVFHEITEPAILEAIKSPRTINLNLVDAQQARRVLDRLVGFKLSPVLWRRVRPSLSAGRVQSVAVRLIVEREREIQRFESEMSYRVNAEFLLSNGKVLTCHLSKSFATAEEAENFLKHCATATFTVEEVQKRPSKRSPAPPFTTSTLQQEAARRLNYPVALTMRIAQSLYESGLITYMRTDSLNLSNLCLSATGKMIEGQMGKEYHQRRTYHTSSKGAQEAHEAIRPAYMDRTEISGTVQEQRLYQLIWRRTMACQMADAQFERTNVTISISGREEQFLAMGEVMIFDGFLKLYEDAHSDKRSGDEDSTRILPPVESGESLSLGDMKATQRYSQPPARYSEETLVKKMEELGIGRPSTYSPTISTILQREYVQRGDRAGESREYEILTLQGKQVEHTSATELVGAEKSKLIPTDIGIVVTDFLQESFPDIMDYNFTANVEKDFDSVAEGEKQWTSLIKDFYGGFNDSVERSMETYDERRVGERVLGTDPKSGEPVSVKVGRYGPVAQIGSADNEGKPRFASLRPEQSIDSITLEDALKLFELPRQLGTLNGVPVRVATGKYGPYLQIGKQYVSIPKEDDPLEIDIKRAAALIKAANDAEKASHIKQFEEEPELEVRAGRFGPYLAYKGKNYKIPKPQAQRAAELSLEECMTIINESKDRAKK